jgi:hypothetical protein
VGGFSEKQIAESLEFLEENHMSWSAAMAPSIMGNPASGASAEVPAPIIIAKAPSKLQLVAHEPDSKALPPAATERRRRRHVLHDDRRRRSPS